MQQSQRSNERKVDSELEAHLLALSCGEPTEGFAQWTLRLLADRAVELEYVDSLSYEMVRRCTKINEIKPWRKIGWLIPPEANAEFVAAMERVLNVLIGRCLDRRIGSMEKLCGEVAAWQARREQIYAKLNWQFTTENSRIKRKRLYPAFDA